TCCATNPLWPASSWERSWPTCATRPSRPSRASPSPPSCTALPRAAGWAGSRWLSWAPRSAAACVTSPRASRPSFWASASNAMRAQFGVMNAGLNETVTGIDVVKATAQESFEQHRFGANAGRYRDLFVRNGQIQARYVPPLLLAVAMAGAFVHGLYLVAHHGLSIGGLVSYMGLMGLLRWPSFSSIFTFALLQFGVAASRRIVALLGEETELD